MSSPSHSQLSHISETQATTEPPSPQPRSAPPSEQAITLPPSSPPPSSPLPSSPPPSALLPAPPTSPSSSPPSSSPAVAETPPTQPPSPSPPSPPPSKIYKPEPATRGFRADTLLRQQPPYQSSCESLNVALHSGLHANRVTQLCGTSLSGKTMLALSFAARILSTGGGVLWLETTHSAWEIRTRVCSLMATRRPPHAASLALVVVPVPTIVDALAALAAVKADLLFMRVLPPTTATTPQPRGVFGALSRLRLVVFDSAAAVLSPLLGLRIPPAWSGHVALDQLAIALRWLAAETCAAVIVTNRVVMKNQRPHPALGNKWMCFVDVNLTLQREDVHDVVATFESQVPFAATVPIISICVQSKRDRPRRCRVCISDNGIGDIPVTQVREQKKE